MNTFDERVREYPIIAIDHFIDTIRPEIFVLSHIHAGISISFITLHFHSTNLEIYH
jgi:hypothetical protein